MFLCRVAERAIRPTIFIDETFFVIANVQASPLNFLVEYRLSRWREILPL
jgi:hypothetical protein